MKEGQQISDRGWRKMDADKVWKYNQNDWLKKAQRLFDVQGE